ncbi:MAG: hypothetical protein R2710_11110 [Acidimicrobiales bacterium]
MIRAYQSVEGSIDGTPSPFATFHPSSMFPYTIALGLGFWAWLFTSSVVTGTALAAVALCAVLVRRSRLSAVFGPDELIVQGWRARTTYSPHDWVLIERYRNTGWRYDTLSFLLRPMNKQDTFKVPALWGVWPTLPGFIRSRPIRVAEAARLAGFEVIVEGNPHPLLYGPAVERSDNTGA